MAFSDPSPGSATRAHRPRVPCRICRTPIEVGRMREHLRTEHQLDSSRLEEAFLAATRDARRARRSRS